MSLSPRVTKTGAALLSGLSLGAAGAYAVSASAAGSATAVPSMKHAAKASSAGGLRLTRLRRAVSLTAVVPVAGGRFATISLERGTLTSISGDRLTISEGTRGASYRSVTVTVPADALVRLSRKPSTLSSLTVGERVSVLQGPRRTAVLARPASATPQGGTGSSQ